MDHQSAARGFLSLVCAGQGVGALAVDLNRTHATNPQWSGHARFHLVWQSFSVFLLGAVEVALIWWNGPLEAQRFYLAAILAGAPMVAFLAAFAARAAYGGTLNDPNGIPPLRLKLPGRTLQVDLNLVVELVSLAILGLICWLYA